MDKVIWYKGYGIDFDFYGTNEYSVQYCGDDMIFQTPQQAKDFIDEIQKNTDCSKCRCYKCGGCDSAYQ